MNIPGHGWVESQVPMPATRAELLELLTSILGLTNLGKLQISGKGNPITVLWKPTPSEESVTSPNLGGLTDVISSLVIVESKVDLQETILELSLVDQVPSFLACRDRAELPVPDRFKHARVIMGAEVVVVDTLPEGTVLLLHSKYRYPAFFSCEGVIRIVVGGHNGSEE